MALSPDGRKLFVACGRSGTVTVVDTTTHARLADIAVGTQPWAIR